MQNTFVIIALKYVKHVEMNVANIRQSIARNVRRHVKNALMNAEGWPHNYPESPVLFFIVLAALRTQTPTGEKQYMKAMIPFNASMLKVK